MAISSSESPMQDHRWRLVALLSLSIFINYVDRGNLSVAAPVLGRELTLSPAQLGLLVLRVLLDILILPDPRRLAGRPVQREPALCRGVHALVGCNPADRLRSHDLRPADRYGCFSVLESRSPIRPARRFSSDTFLNTNADAPTR